MPEITEEYWKTKGYKTSRKLETGVWAGIRPAIYTTELCVGLDDTGIHGPIYHYKEGFDALLDLMMWNGQDDPIGPWIKRKGKDGDFNNPVVIKKPEEQAQA